MSTRPRSPHLTTPGGTWEIKPGGWPVTTITCSRSAPPRGLGALQAQIEFALPGGQALPGCGFQQLQLELVTGRAKVLESLRGGIVTTSIAALATTASTAPRAKSCRTWAERTAFLAMVVEALGR